ncbi:VRR-NUC domain-containing protein [Seinonella peptonophila]|uniref:VRR-NUC domain-containing protein n=1 Tax=Seinonella peptonophila TaxID=112248 RepID=A0A1M5A1B4_9BACL|nr:VRR-NUC domain-containing protein [Seinonella peptonophila]SHF23706.1 VRR-NUC domain-containing protein [Seinonella peptonophila]
MREKQLEQRLKQEVEKAGGLALKFISPGWAGAPDRIVLLPEGRIIFVEMKAPKGQLRPLQKKRLQQLKDLGFDTRMVNSVDQIREMVIDEEVKRSENPDSCGQSED